MSHDMPSPEEMEKAAASITPEQIDLGDTRAGLFEKAKAESGLDSETFDEMSRTFESESDGTITRYNFKIHGHEISGSLVGNFTPEASWYVDGTRLDLNKSISLIEKYKKAIRILMELSNKKIERKNMDSIVEDLLK